MALAKIGIGRAISASERAIRDSVLILELHHDPVAVTAGRYQVERDVRCVSRDAHLTRLSVGVAVERPTPCVTSVDYLHTVYSMQVVTKTSLSADAAEQIREMITSGLLAAGSRINEVHLSEQLGVSRTPLREALAALVSEGALENRPRKGNFVRPLSREEFTSLYGIRPILDVEALRLSGVPSQDDLDALSVLNDKLKLAKNARTRIARDDEWHLRLVQNCGNPILLDLIKQFMFRTRRYEIAYLRDSDNVSTAYDEHRAIIRCLARGDLSAACTALTQNLSSGVAPILAWLDAKQGQNDE